MAEQRLCRKMTLKQKKKSIAAIDVETNNQPATQPATATSIRRSPVLEGSVVKKRQVKPNLSFSRVN
jgi:hypothetical protein